MLIENRLVQLCFKISPSLFFPDLANFGTMFDYSTEIATFLFCFFSCCDQLEIYGGNQHMAAAQQIGKESNILNTKEKRKAGNILNIAKMQ